MVTEEISYREILKKDILQNKLLMGLSLFVGVLCFGFTIANFSIGIDDVARGYYLYSREQGNMIQQGRLMHVALNALTHSVQFIPFFTEFVGASLYVLSALLLCALFRYVTVGKLSTAALAVFAGVYISSSILTEKYIYHLDVIATMVSYCCNALALLYSYRFVQRREIRSVLAAVPLLMGAVSSYESYIFLYISGVFALFILEIGVNKEDKTFRELLTEGLIYAGILLVALALYYGLVVLLQCVTGQFGVFSRTLNLPEGLGILGTVSYLTGSFVQTFSDAIADRYLPILVFCLCSGVCLGLLVVMGLERKNIWVCLCFAAMWLCNFGVHYAAGTFLYRAAQTFCFFCGFVLMLLLEVFPSRAWRKLMCVAAGLLVFVQAADMNRWFYNDYVRYQKEAYTIHAMANEILGECDVEKPVVFTCAPAEGYLDTALYSGRQVNGNSLLYWCCYAFSDPTQRFVAETFRMHGYDFIRSPDETQFEHACGAAKNMPAWPQEGSIRELSDVIVVNFG